jgi:hypothetical protein
VSDRVLIVTLALAAALAAAAWWTRPPPRERAWAPVQRAESFALGVDAAGVRAVEVSAGGVVARVAREGGWTLTLPDAHGGVHRWPADADAVRGMIRALVATPLEDREGGVEPGAVDPIAAVRLESADGPPVELAATGRALGGRIPLRVTTAAGVRRAFIDAERFRPASPEHLAALADARPFAVGSGVDRGGGGGGGGAIAALSIDAGESGFRLERRAGLWRVAGSEARVDRDAVGTFLDALTRVRAAGVVYPFDADAIGRAVVRIQADAPLPRAPGQPPGTRSFTLTIGEQASIEGAIYALAERTEPGEARLLITLDPSSLPPLPAGVDTLLDPIPLPIPADEGGVIEVRAGDHHRTLTRRVEGWTGDGIAARALLDELRRPRPARLLAGGERLPPAAELIVSPLGTGGVARLSLIESPEGLFLTDGSVAWACMPALLDTMRRLAGSGP